MSGLTERVARALASSQGIDWDRVPPGTRGLICEDARAALGAVADDVDGLTGVLRDHCVIQTSGGWYCDDEDCEWMSEFGSEEGDEPDPQTAFARHQAAMLAAHTRGAE